MLTEVDTRTEYGTGRTVGLYMDKQDNGSATEYTVCVEGFAPLTTQSPARAVEYFQHPYVYLPAEALVSPSNGTEGDTPTDESCDNVAERVGEYTGAVNTVDPEELSTRTAAMLVEMKNLLTSMSHEDFAWTTGLIADVVNGVSIARKDDGPKPYDHEADGPDIPF